MNRKIIPYALIVLISSLIFGWFLNEQIITNTSTATKTAVIILNIVIFFALWLSFSLMIAKKSKERKESTLKREALTYSVFFILIIFPLLNLFSLQEKYAIFSKLPGLLLMIVPLSLFAGLKVLFYPIRFHKIEIKPAVIYGIIIAYFLIFTTITILKHNSFHSTALDLGIYDNEVWHYSKGNIEYNTVVGVYLLGDHTEYILFLIAPLYLLYSSPITLLVLQTALLAISALPVFWLAKKKLNDFAALLITAAYLIYPSIHYVNLFDFHPVTLSIPFITFSLYFLYKKKYVPMFVFISLAAMCKEHLPLLFITYGVFIFFFHKKRKMGVITSIIGLAWTSFNMFLVIPIFSQGLGYYYTSTVSGIFHDSLSGYIGLAKELIVNKFPFMILLLIPMGFGIFAFLSPIILLSIFQLGIVNILLRSLGISEIIYQHQASLIPFIVISTIYGIKNVGKWIKKTNLYAGSAAFILICSILSMLFYGPFSIVYDLTSFSTQTEYVKAGHKIIWMIPDEASVSTLSWAIPHLSHRDEIYIIRGTNLRSTLRPLPKYLQNKTPEYVLIDLSNTFMDKSRGGGNINSSQIGHIFNNPDYGIIEKENVWVLLKKGTDYEEGICKVTEFLNKEKYPYLEIEIENKGALEKCSSK